MPAQLSVIIWKVRFTGHYNRKRRKEMEEDDLDIPPLSDEELERMFSHLPEPPPIPGARRIDIDNEALPYDTDVPVEALGVSFEDLKFFAAQVDQEIGRAVWNDELGVLSFVLPNGTTKSVRFDDGEKRLRRFMKLLARLSLPAPIRVFFIGEPGAVREMLEMMGYRVLRARNYEECRKAIERANIVFVAPDADEFVLGMAFMADKPIQLLEEPRGRLADLLRKWENPLSGMDLDSARRIDLDSPE